MTSIETICRKRFQRPVRRCYIKRRLIDGTYEQNWLRVDFYKSRNQVLDGGWGEFSLQIDHQPGQIGNFEISELQMEFSNQFGYWNVEADFQSIWAPDSVYLNRKFTRLKVEAGFLAADGSEIGTDTIFEGIIDKVELSEGRARVTILPYTSILNRYPISDLALSGPKSVKEVVDMIMSRPEITEFIPFIESTPTSNKTITETADLSGKYWDVIKELAKLSNSIPVLSVSDWYFGPRAPSQETKWVFYGSGYENPDIERVTAYDDEGAENVRTVWQTKNDDGSLLTVKSSNKTLLLKYLQEPEDIDLSLIEESDRLPALKSLLSYWEKNRPTVTFLTNFMMNILRPLDRIVIKKYGQLLPLGQVRRWGSGFEWGDGTVWGKVRGSVNILGGSWMITRIGVDISAWKFSITAEKIV